MTLWRFIATRVALGLVTLFVISMVTFVATNVVPVDPAKVALGRFADPAQLALYRKEQGLDKPLIQRYGRWLGDFVQGDWGTSTVTQRSVSSDVAPRLARTVILGGGAMLLAVPLAFFIGIKIGRTKSRIGDLLTSIVTLFLNSMPEFVVGFILLVVLGVSVHALPIESSGAAYATGFKKVEAYILPMLTLTVLLTPYMVRMVRANVRDVASRSFVRSAMLRGVSPRRLSWRHIAPNATLPVVNVVALTLADLVGGVVVVETVFGFPGIGQLLVQAVVGKDIPTVQTITMLVGIGFVLTSFLADAAVLVLNPRLRTA